MALAKLFNQYHAPHYSAITRQEIIGYSYEIPTVGNVDGFVKSPISALRFILRHCGVR